MLEWRLLLTPLLWLAIAPVCDAGFSGGSGTQQDPFQVSTVEQLAQIKDNLAAHYRLINDLDFSGSGVSWNPLGESLNNAFRGSFDGANHTIANFQLPASPGTKHTSLFHFAREAAFRNVRLTGVQLISDKQSSNAAGLVGFAMDTTFDNCHVSGTVENTQQADAFGTSWVGLLVGRDNNASYSRCSTAGSATGPVYVGGLVGGISSDSLVRHCYSSAAVRSTDDGVAGGLVGEVYRSSVQDSYATGTVSGRQSIGGLAGRLRDSCNVTRCYAVSAVSGTGVNIGGLIGESSTTASANVVTDSYWSPETSGQEASAGGTRVESAQGLRARSSFTNWNFQLDWALRESSGFPYLQLNAPATATPLLDWLDYFGLDEAEASADIDADGVVSMIEYFTGSNPSVSSSLEQQLVRESGNLLLSFRSNRPFAPSGVRLSVIAAPGLKDGELWVEIAAPFTVAESGGYRWTCSIPASVSAASERYFRLRVTDQ